MVSKSVDAANVRKYHALWMSHIQMSLRKHVRVLTKFCKGLISLQLLYYIM